MTKKSIANDWSISHGGTAAITAPFPDTFSTTEMGTSMNMGTASQR
jgi:hypothetical protein